MLGEITTVIGSCFYQMNYGQTTAGTVGISIHQMNYGQLGISKFAQI